MNRSPGVHGLHWMFHMIAPKDVVSSRMKFSATRTLASFETQERFGGRALAFQVKSSGS